MQIIQRAKQYHFDWKLSLFTVALFPFLFSLGLWQLDREAEKLELQALYESRFGVLPFALSELDLQSDLQYVPVNITGSYDNAHIFLLDNKINNAQVGYEIIVPFISDEDEIVFINRGWAAQGALRTDLPVIENISGQVSLSGAVYVPLGELIILGEEESSQQWPRVIQSLNLDSLQQQLNLNAVQQTKVFPYTVRLAPVQSGVLVRNWPVITTGPQKHRGYAIQWFLMSIVLLGLYLIRSTSTTEIAENR